MKAMINYSNDNNTFQILNGREIEFKSEKGLKKSLAKHIENNIGNLTRMYGRGVKLTVEVIGLLSKKEIAKTTIQL